MTNPDLSPEVSILKSRQQRDDAAAQIKTRLSGDTLAQFNAMFQASQDHVSISEGRALWQLILVGSLRVPFLALGRKLVEAGAIAEANDVFYFKADELVQLAANPRPMQAEVAARQADHARQKQLTPPPFLGAPPDPSSIPPEMHSLLRFFFGVLQPPSVIDNVIGGQAASRGIARGRARVIRELADADSLQQGDILVCETTSPPWTPLFAVAGGVVTNAGGILSHSAICAREYAIPCVVATHVATRVIPHGAMIEIDGDKGTVRILA